MSLLQFVDTIASSPTVRLSLNDGVVWKLVADGTRFTPPPLRRAFAQTLLRDGAHIPADAYDNRVIQLRLALLNSTADAQATQIQTLCRELNRPTNVLKWQPAGATHPVFFRTFRSDIGQIDRILHPSRQQDIIDLELLAEPFAYGLKETLGGALNANPYFETDASNWTLQAGASFVRSTAQFHQGVASGLLTPDGSSATAEARAENVPATAAAAYQAQAWVRCAAARNVSVNINWRDAGGGLLGVTTTTTAVAATTWTLITVPATPAPASTTQAQVTVTMSSTPPGSHLLHIDEAILSQSFQVSNDPAAVNGCLFDVIGVKGDVETPLFVKVPTTQRGQQSALAVRRRGDPTQWPFVLQAESMTMLLGDTTVQANDAAFSGSGSNWVRTTFASTAAFAGRITGQPFPTGANVNYRGTYRVFLRCRKTVSGDPVQVRLFWLGGTTAITNDAVTLPTSTSIIMVDLGLVSIPVGPDPVCDGPTGVEISTRGLTFTVEAARTSGTTNYDYDYLLFVPADDRFAIMQWAAGSSNDDRLILDGLNDTSYGIVNSTGELVPQNAPILQGGLPMLSPGVVNRIYYLNEVKPSTAEAAFPTSWAFEPYYWPRYLHVRPAST